MRTKHKFTIVKRIKPDSKIFICVKDVYIDYNIDSGMHYDMTVHRIDNDIAGDGCIWNHNLLVMDNEHPNILKDVEKFGFNEYIKTCYDWTIILVDGTKDIAPDGAISTTHEIFQ